MFYKSIDVYSVTYVVGKSIFSISMYNIVSELGNHDFSHRQAVNKLKGRKIFSDQTNRSRLDLILASCDRNCCSMEKLRCSKFAVNEIF